MEYQIKINKIEKENKILDNQYKNNEIDFEEYSLKRNKNDNKIEKIENEQKMREKNMGYCKSTDKIKNIPRKLLRARRKIKDLGLGVSSLDEAVETFCKNDSDWIKFMRFAKDKGIINDEEYENSTEKERKNELNNSKKLKTWEHSYKNTDYNIKELDENIKELISEHLRNIKSSSKKTKKRHQSRKHKKKPQTKKPKRKQTKKKPKKKEINKIFQMKIPNNRNIRWVWLVRKREDGRYIVRYPKKNILINKLSKKRDKDFYPQKLAPKNSKILR
tara:strand:+ start:262 stop:1086 length:825 start_codon:yes stop_codon:yes gene_type:complete